MPMVSYTDKSYLRTHMAGLRRSQPAGLARARSLEAQERLMADDIWKKARCVALYCAMRTELDTRLLMARALAQGKRLFLPRVVAGVKGAMEFVPVDSVDRLVRSSMGILEPPKELPGFSGFATFAPQLVVVPGVAFDIRGGRLGFGGGYYDRFLQDATCPRVGLCFAFQVVRSLPAESWDVPMTHLCTEERLVALA